MYAHDFKSMRIAAHAQHITKVRERFRTGHPILPQVIMDILCSFYEPTEFEHFEQVIATGGVYATLLPYGRYGVITLGPQLLSCLFLESSNQLVSLMAEFDYDRISDLLTWNMTKLFEKGDIAQWEFDDTFDDKVVELSTMFCKRYFRSAKALLRRGL